MPCSNSSGTHKMKLLTLGKSPKPRTFGSKPTVSDVPRTEKKLMLKAVLILDNTPGHPEILSSDVKNVVVIHVRNTASYKTTEVKQRRIRSVLG